jgi:Flp pilus assembly protein TadD
MEESMQTSIRLSLAAVLCLALAGTRAIAQGEDAEMIFNVGLGHLRDNRPAQALEELQRAAKKEPKNPYFQKGVGLAHLALRQYPEAIASFRKALELNPYYADARNDLGTALLLSGQRDEGKNELLRAFNDPLNPRPDLTARNLGRAYLDDKAFDTALTWFKTSVQRNRRLSEGYLGIAATLTAQGRVEDAIAGLEEGLSNTADSTDVLVALGEAYYRAGRFAEARTRLERAVKKEAESPAGRRAAELLQNFPR